MERMQWRVSRARSAVLVENVIGEVQLFKRIICSYTMSILVV
jgi:hypothetical protein